MAIRNQLMAATLADLYSSPITDTQTIVLWGQTVIGDVPVRYYLYVAASTATDDGGVTVVQPTAVTGSGRYILQTNGQTLSDWNSASGYSKINNKPSLATIATSGSYADLSGKPSIPVAQQVYQGITLRTNSFPIFKTGTVSGGVVVFNLTNDGTSTGTALFPNGIVAESVNIFVSDATASYQMSYAFTNSNKTLTVTANKLTTANILTGILGQASANGSIVTLQVYGY